MPEIKNIGSLIEEIKKTESQFDNAQLWFRGQRDYSWNLIPSVHRVDPILETEFANRFRLQAPGVHSNCPPTKDYPKWLPFMQHYGLPTRLLDWTESPLIALFFAAENRNFSGDRSLWMLAPGKLNLQYGFEPIPFLENEQIKTTVENTFNHEKKETPYEFLSVTAPHHDSRISMQMAQFTIHNVREPLEKHANAMTFIRKFKIPDNAIQIIRTELNILGVRRSKIYPDLDNLAKEISEIIAI